MGFHTYRFCLRWARFSATNPAYAARDPVPEELVEPVPAVHAVAADAARPARSRPRRSSASCSGSPAIEIGGTRPGDITVHDPRFYERVLRDASIGFGESYMEGWWETDALDVLIEKIMRANLKQKITGQLAAEAR